MMPQLRSVFAAVVLSAAAPPALWAQQADASQPDPQAAAAFAQLVKDYRDHPFLRVKSTLKIELRQEDVVAESREVVAEFTYSRGGAGIVNINGFTCWFRDGVLWAIHEDTDDCYYRTNYEGAAYWVLWDIFRDLPYPHVALLWGDEAAEDVHMELHSETPMIAPREMSEIEVDGKVLKRLMLRSDNGVMQIDIDPKTNLIETMEHTITGGMFVEPGASKRTMYSLDYTTFDEPLPDGEFAFDPGKRQRVDLFAALAPPPEIPEGPAVPQGAVGDIIGAEAPPFVLATADGKAVDVEDFRGKVVVLDFWATWCRPCVVALPLLHEVATWARQEELPVEVLTVNVWEARGDQDNPDARLAAVRAFWKKNNFTLPVAMDYTDETAAAYRVQGIPTTFIIRSDGIIHARHAGFSEDYVENLKAEIRAALGALDAVTPDDAE